MKYFDRLSHSEKGIEHFPELIARYIVYFLIANSLITTLSYSILIFESRRDMERFWGSVIFIPIFASLLIFIRRGYIRLTKSIAVSLNFALILLQVWLDGGIKSPDFFTLLIGIILATLAFGLRGTIITCALSLAAGYAFTHLQTHPTVYTEPDIMVAEFSTFMTIAFYFYFSIRVFRNELTRNVQLNEKLSNSEARMKRLIQNLPIGAIVSTQSGEITLVNRCLEQMTGYNQENIKTSDDWYRLMYPDPQLSAEIRLYFDHLPMNGDHQIFNNESQIWSHSGSCIDIEVFITTLGEDIVVLVNDITGRKKAEKEIAAKFSQLSSLRTLDIAIINSEGLTDLFDIFLNQISSQLQSDAIWVMLRDSSDEAVLDVVTNGFPQTPSIKSVHIHQEIRDLLIHPETVIITNPVAIATIFGVGQTDFSFCATIPLTTKNNVVGLLSVFRRQPFTPDADWLRFFEALAGQTAIGIDRINLTDSLKELNQSLVTAYDATIEGWARALELRDKETEGHSRRVAEMTIDLAQAIGIPEKDLKDIYRGALLHDIGKMPVPDRILLKNGPLTDEEWVLMRQHPETAYHLLKGIPFLQHAVEIPYGHHEHWDGSGYPQGLKGEQIPLAARLFAFADVWDALCSDRPYRDAWPEDKVLNYILELSGKQFDPAIVPVFEKMMKSGNIQEKINRLQQ